MIQQEFSSITLYITNLDHKRTVNSWLLWGCFRFTINSVLCWGFQNVDPGCLWDSKGTQRTRTGAGEEIGAGAASPLTVVLPTKPRKTTIPGGVLGLIFAWYVPLVSQSPSPIIVYSGPILDPILVIFGQIFNFRDPNLVTFNELTIF